MQFVVDELLFSLKPAPDIFPKSAENPYGEKEKQKAISSGSNNRCIR